MKIPFSAYDFFGTLAAGFLILATTDFAFDGGWLLKAELSPVLTVTWLMIAYVTGHIVAHLSSVFIEHTLVRRWLGSPEEHLLATQKPKGLPSRLFPGNFQPLPAGTQRRIRDKARQLGVETKGRAFFFHCHPIVKREAPTHERLNSFLNLYGFCRNMSMAATLAAPLLLVGSLRDLDTDNLHRSVHYEQLWAALAAALAAIGMFYRYLKSFRHYTLEVFMAYAEAKVEQSNPAQGGEEACNTK